MPPSACRHLFVYQLNWCMFVHLLDTLLLLNIQHIGNVMFANIFSCLFPTSLTFQMNMSYHEYSFDRFVWTRAAAWMLHTNNSAPSGCFYLLWQGQLILLREKRSLTRTAHSRGPERRIEICSTTWGQKSSPDPQTCQELHNEYSTVWNLLSVCV